MFLISWYTLCADSTHSFVLTARTAPCGHAYTLVLPSLKRNRAGVPDNPTRFLWGSGHNPTPLRYGIHDNPTNILVGFKRQPRKNLAGFEPTC